MDELQKLRKLYNYLDYRLEIRKAERLLDKSGLTGTVIDLELGVTNQILIYNPEYMGVDEGFTVPVHKSEELVAIVKDLIPDLRSSGFHLTKVKYEEEFGIKITKKLPKDEE